MLKFRIYVKVNFLVIYRNISLIVLRMRKSTRLATRVVSTILGSTTEKGESSYVFVWTQRRRLTSRKVWVTTVHITARTVKEARSLAMAVPYQDWWGIEGNVNPEMLKYILRYSPRRLKNQDIPAPKTVFRLQGCINNAGEVIPLVGTAEWILA